MMNSQNHSVAAALPSPPPAAAAPTIIVYPTVSPQTVIVPIISSIAVFPAAALTVICCLRYRAKRARRRAKQPRLSDRAERAVPVIRIDGSRRPESGLRGKSKKRDSRSTNELHFTSATVFQAVLGIDLDLDERSEWENEVMGYTTVRGGVSSPTSSVGSLQAFPALNSVQPRLIQMEMSPRAVRSARSSPGCDPPPGHVTPPPGQPTDADTWRPPAEAEQRNGRPPGPLTESPRLTPGEGTEGLQRNGHGPPELHVRRSEDGVGKDVPRRTAEADDPQPQQPSLSEDEDTQQCGGPDLFWREPLRFIDDSSEAS